jgi:hypothetical protein
MVDQILSFHWMVFFWGLFLGILTGIRLRKRHDVYTRRLTEIALTARHYRHADANHCTYFEIQKCREDLFDLIDCYDQDVKKGTLK